MKYYSKPRLVGMTEFNDHRGSVHHYSNFELDSIKRIYFISPRAGAGFRGWHAHVSESKVFRCPKRSFEVSSVEVEDWEAGTSSKSPQTWVLSESSGELLVVPAGYANGIRTLAEGSVLMVISNRTLPQSEADDYRFSESNFPILGLGSDPKYSDF